MLVHAPSKVGKSTLMSTAPPPILNIDVEGSWRFIKTAGFRGPAVRKITWDPLVGPPPTYDGTWDICTVMVRDWGTLSNTHMWLSQAPHQFRSVITDSVTEAQRKLKTNLRGLDQMRIQDWGDLLVQMDKWVRDMRDLVLLPGSPVKFIGFVAETEMKEGKWRPAMQGQIGRALPYWVDICGYLYTEQEQDANGQPTVKVKKLLIMSDHPQFESGERVQGLLGDVIRSPNITEMMNIIFGVVESTQPEGVSV
jgi:AAA domain-containing protein